MMPAAQEEPPTPPPSALTREGTPVARYAPGSAHSAAQIKLSFVPLDSSTSDEVLRSGYKALVNLTLKVTKCPRFFHAAIPNVCYIIFQTSKSWNHVLNYFRGKWSNVPQLEGRLEVFALDASMGSVLGPNLLQPPRSSPVGMSRLPHPMPCTPSSGGDASPGDGANVSVHQLHYRLAPLLPVGNVDRTFGDLMLQMLLNRNGPGGGAADGFGQLLLSSPPTDAPPAPLLPTSQTSADNSTSHVVGPRQVLPHPVTIDLSSVHTLSRPNRGGLRARGTPAPLPMPPPPPAVHEAFDPPHGNDDNMDPRMSENTMDFLLNSLVNSNTGSQYRAPIGDRAYSAAPVGMDPPVTMTMTTTTMAAGVMSENTINAMLLSILGDGGTLPSRAPAAPHMHGNGFAPVASQTRAAATKHSLENADDKLSDSNNKKARNDVDQLTVASRPSSGATTTRHAAAGTGLVYPILIGQWERAKVRCPRPAKRLAPHRIGNPGDSTLFMTKAFME